MSRQAIPTAWTFSHGTNPSGLNTTGPAPLRSGTGWKVVARGMPLGWPAPIGQIWREAYWADGRDDG